MMFRLFTILFIVSIFRLNAQTSAPKLINYQGLARDAAGVPITSNFDIQFIIKDATSVVHNEVQIGISPNSLGLFSTLIGKPPNTLTVTALNTGPFSLDVLIKTGSSFTLIGTQPLVSVPFALHANNVPSSYTNNILTIGANSYSINSGSTITPTLSGDVVGSNSTTTVTALRNIPIAAITPTNNQVLSFISGSWTPVSSTVAAVSPWVKTGNTVTLSAINDNVGIGTNIPNATLDALGSASTTTSILKVTNSNTSNPSPAIIVSSNGGAAINATENSAAGANAGEFTSINGGAIYGLTIEETKSAILGENSSGTSNSLAHGIYGKTSNPDPNAAGIFGENLGNGHGIKGVTNGPSSAIRGINLHTATSAALADGVYGTTNNSSSLAAGVYGLNSGGGPGVYGTSSFAGVIGLGSAGGPGVQGNNIGTGHAIHGLKTGASGNAGRFEINNTGNSADALFASTLGSGAAVHAAANTLPNSALGLWIENGHIKVTGDPTFSITALTPSVSGGFTFPNVSVNGNDVKGIISFTTGVTGFTTVNFCDIKINFGKPYTTPPIIVATPLTDLQGLSYIISNVQTSGFILRIYRPINMSLPSGTSITANIFNYIVIE